MSKASNLRAKIVGAFAPTPMDDAALWDHIVVIGGLSFNSNNPNLRRPYAGSHHTQNGRIYWGLDDGSVLRFDYGWWRFKIDHPDDASAQRRTWASFWKAFSC